MDSFLGESNPNPDNDVDYFFRSWKDLERDCKRGFIWGNDSCSFDTLATTLLIMVLELSPNDQIELLKFNDNDSSFFTAFFYLLSYFYRSWERSYRDIMITMSNVCRKLMRFDGSMLSLSEAFQLLFLTRSAGGAAALKTATCERFCMYQKGFLQLERDDVAKFGSIEGLLNDLTNSATNEAKVPGTLSPLLLITVPPLLMLEHMVNESRMNVKNLKGTDKQKDAIKVYKNEKTFKHNRNSFRVERLVTIKSKDGSTQSFELVAVAFYLAKLHFVAHIKCFGHWMYYDGDENDGKFQCLIDRNWMSLFEKNSFTLQQLDRNKFMYGKESSSVAGLFYRKVADQTSQQKVDSLDLMSKTIQRGHPVANFLSTIPYTSHVDFDERIQELEAQVQESEIQLLNRGDHLKIPAPTDAVMSDRRADEYLVLQDPIDLIDGDAANDSFQDSTSVEGDELEVLSPELPNDHLLGLLQCIDNFIKRACKEVPHVHDISCWDFQEKKREIRCLEVDIDKYNLGKRGYLKGFIVDQKASIAQYTLSAQKKCDVIGIRSKAKKETNILVKKMLFLQHPNFWDPNFTASPLCQNNKCTLLAHLVFERINKAEPRSNCWGGIYCKHTPRCLLPGKNPRGRKDVTLLLNQTPDHNFQSERKQLKRNRQEAFYSHGVETNLN